MTYDDLAYLAYGSWHMKGATLANCADLIAKLEEWRQDWLAHKDRTEEFYDFVQERLPDLTVIGEQLNQRLVHRDFLSQAFVDVQKNIALAGDVVAARVGQVVEALTGETPPNNSTPDGPTTDLGLNADTSGSGGEGGEGGEGGGA